MAEAAKHALELETFNVVADAGYSNGEQVAHCESAGMMPYVPVMRTVNNQGDGTYSVVPTSVMNQKAIRTSVPETRGCYANILITKTDTRCISVACRLRRLLAEVTLHTSSETWFSSPFVRRRSEPDAGARYAGSDETAPMHG
jgi:hypothetical protein